MARLSAWLGTGGVLILTGWLAAIDGGYFSREFYTGAVCAWTLAGLVVLMDWDNLKLPRASLVPLIFCAAVLLMTGASTFWSISPGSSVKEFSRVALYLACFFLVLSGPARRREVIVSSAAFTALGTALATFALFAKISPDYSQEFAEAGGRIMGSLGYWNALAIFMVISILPCLWLSSSPEISRIGRVAATSAMFIIGVTLFLTLSRGGLAIGAFSIILWLAISSDRLASILSLLAAALPGGVLILRTFTALPSLHSSSIETRIDPAEGRQFAIMLAAGIFAAALLKTASLTLPARLPATRGWLTLTMIFWAAIIVFTAFAGLNQRTRIADKLNEWQSRPESSSSAGNDEPLESEGILRLATFDGERLEHWRIGFESFQQHPLAGTGAGTYRFANLQLQSGVGLARDPHSIWIRFLSEQGIIGFLLLLLLTGSIAYGLIRPLFTTAALRGDGLYLALIVALAAWLADSSLEWNWALPAVTIPFFFIAGLAFRLTENDDDSAGIVNPASDTVPVWLRMAAMAMAMILSAFFLSLIVSVVFSERANGRLSAGEVDAADLNARRASRLNPYDAQPLVIRSRIAAALGNYVDARELLLEAMDLEPEQSSHHERLALLEFYSLQDTYAGIASLSRALDLDPQNRDLHILLHRLHADAEIFRTTGEMPAQSPDSVD